MHKILFYNKFIMCLYMFRALCAHHQEVKIALYSIWYQLPPSNVAKLEVAAQKIWPVPEAVVTVLCTPDDGCG